MILGLRQFLCDPLGMRHTSRVLVIAANVALMFATVLAGPAMAQPSPAAIDVTPDWRGSRDAMPASYAWLNDYTPSDTYTIVVVRGMRRAGVLKRLGGVKRRLSDKTPNEAGLYYFDHLKSDYTGPRVVQVQRRGHAVVVYAPYGILRENALAKLSRRGVAAEFFTDVELDTYVTVAKRGALVRSFDAGFRPPKKGSLPAEEGLDWGARKQNIWATAWAFNERLTRTHISREWFDDVHPTFVMKKGSLL